MLGPHRLAPMHRDGTAAQRVLAEEPSRFRRDRWGALAGPPMRMKPCAYRARSHRWRGFRRRHAENNRVDIQNTRTFGLDCARADDAQRTVPLVLSSETPVQRRGYDEVLDHGPRSIDLGSGSLPLLVGHDTGPVPVATVENLHVTPDRKLRGIARFGTSARALEVFADVKAGVIRAASVGYRILDYVTDGNTLRATRWQPYEVSAVGVGADPAAGFFRARSPQIEGMQPMNESIENPPAADAGQLSRSQRRAANIPDPAAIALEAERARVADIQAGAHALEKHEGMRDLGDKAIAEGWSMEKFRRSAMQLMASAPTEIYAVGPEGGEGVFVGYRNGPGPVAPMGSEGRMATPRHPQYSIVRALASMIDPQSVDASREREFSEGWAKRSGRKPRGMYVPIGELQKRDLTVGGAPALVGTQHLAASFIDALRARSVVMQLGPTLLSGLTGNVEIPRLTTPSTAYWIAGDGSDGLTASTPAYDKLTLSPKTVGALVNLSRKMILQGEPAAEDLVRNDLAQVVATALDVAAIQGTGASNQPTGIVNTSGISTADFAAATPTFAEIVAMESALTGANVDAANAAYVTTPALAGLLKTTPITNSTNGLMIWQASADPGVGVMNGLRAYGTANVPTGQVILGNWRDLVIGMWGAIDIEVNPYADFAKGTVSVRCFASIDLAVRHAKSFAVYSQP